MMTLVVLAFIRWRYEDQEFKANLCQPNSLGPDLGILDNF